MKSYIALSLISAALTGCISISTSKPSTQAFNLDGSPSVENAIGINRTISRGQLTCEAGQICPELAIDWKQTKGEYPVTLHYYDQNKLDISAISFIVDGNTYNYNTLSQTNYRPLAKSNIIDSSNTVLVPKEVLKNFKQAQSIAVIMNTNQGEIAHYMLKNQKSSDAYRLFLRAYS